MKPRVLHLIETLGLGGAERQLHSNLKYLNRKHFDGLVCPLYQRDNSWEAAIRGLGYRVVSPGLRSRWDWRRGIQGLRKLLRDEKIDLIHTHLWDADFYGRLLAHHLGIPVISSLHNAYFELDVLYDDPGMNILKLKLFRYVEQWTSKRWGFSWIAVSEYLREWAIHSLSVAPSSIEVIHNGVDLEAFPKPTAAGREAIRRELGISPDDWVLLSVARLHPQKGQRYLIQALPEILKARRGTHLVLAGGGGHQNSMVLRSLSESLGVSDRVHILGPRRDVSDLLSACDLFLLGSLYEGFGIVLIEAMAMCRPCVATRVGPIPEVVEDGKTGILVEAKSPPQIAAAVRALMSDPECREWMGRQGRTWVEERFDIRRVVASLQDHYERTLEQWSCRTGPTGARDLPLAS